MEMLYHIQGLLPRRDLPMGGYGFCIQLFPALKQAVKSSGLTQDHIDRIIDVCHRAWLDGCGYDKMYDPDVSPRDKWEAKNIGKKLTFGPNAHHLYDRHSIRIGWGEWGPEHITVPGDACGLDIVTGCMSPPDGMMLAPHNIDNPRQVILLLVIFTKIIDVLIAKQP